MFTKERLVNIGAEKLADIILSLCKNKPDIQKQLEMTFASLESDDPENVISMIKKEISSLEEEGTSRFVDCYEGEDSGSEAFTEHLNQVRIHIVEDLLPKFPCEAVEFLIKFLNISHLNIFDEVDDSDEEVGDIFKQACANLGEAYKYTTNSLDDIVNVVYDRYMDNEYGIYDDIIMDFKEALGDNGLHLLKEKLEKSFYEQGKNITATKLGLKNVAECQNDVDAYIMACSFAGEPSANDHLEIAERLIKHCRGKEAIQWLDSVDILDKHALKIKALILCGDKNEVQAERINWFYNTLSLEVYREILQYAEENSIDSFKKTALQKALEFPDSNVALAFLREIKEFEHVAKLIILKIDGLNSSNCDLRSVADILCNIDPLAATLLYRKLIQPDLEAAKSKCYPYAAKDLALINSLSLKITDWQGHQNHQLYFEQFSKKHKMKSKFWPEYESALKKRKIGK